VNDRDRAFDHVAHEPFVADANGTVFVDGGRSPMEQLELGRGCEISR
jgi:hypothetical protein